MSKKRRTQLAYARDELLKYRPASTPVILATNLGREGENVRTVPLGELNVDDRHLGRLGQISFRINW